MTSIFDDVPSVPLDQMPENVRHLLTDPSPRVTQNAPPSLPPVAQAPIAKPTFTPPRRMSERALLEVRELLSKGYRIDEAVIAWLQSSALWVYHLVTSFVLAHVLLWVGKVTRERRRAYCRRCPFRKRKTLLQGFITPRNPSITKDDYCHGGGIQGKGCGCPTTRAWPPSRLTYKTTLRNWHCPMGFWGRTRPSPVSEAELDEFFGVDSRQV